MLSFLSSTASIRGSASLALTLCLYVQTSRVVVAQIQHHSFDQHYRLGASTGWSYGGFSWADYDPYWALSSRIHAQAALVRSAGAAAVDFAAARSLNAEAHSKELDNWMKQVRVYWDRKILKEEKRLELQHVQQIRKMKYLNDRKWRNSRQWEALKNHPRLARGRIRTGDALNFLLDRLAVSALPYAYNAAKSRFSDDVLEELKLEPAWFGSIMLKQGAFVFPANKTAGERIELWPYLLRWNEFETARTAFSEARQAVVQESQATESVSVSSIRRMQESLSRLTNRFYASSSVKDWVRKHKRYTHFANTERFLRQFDREIAAIEKTGDIRPLRMAGRYDPQKAGANLVSFLCFLNRNGVEFAPAQPGKEDAYHRMYVMMRALYLTVADSDESTRPQNLERLSE